MHASSRRAWFLEPRVFAAVGLCLLAFLGNRIVTWSIAQVGLSSLRPHVSFILHVVGTVAFVYGGMLLFEAYAEARRARTQPNEPAESPIEP
jgi:hypothetical protein